MSMSPENRISGERFTARYRIAGAEQEALERAHDLCIEQTVECDRALITDGLIRDHLVGRVALQKRTDVPHYDA